MVRTGTQIEADQGLYPLLDAVARGEDVIFMRDGQPVARLLPVGDSEQLRRIGIAKGRFEMPAVEATSDEDLTQLFRGE